MTVEGHVTMPPIDRVPWLRLVSMTITREPGPSSLLSLLLFCSKEMTCSYLCGFSQVNWKLWSVSRCVCVSANSRLSIDVSFYLWWTCPGCTLPMTAGMSSSRHTQPWVQEIEGIEKKWLVGWMDGWIILNKYIKEWRRKRDSLSRISQMNQS